MSFHFENCFKRVYDSMSYRDFLLLLSPQHHSSLLARRRAEMIISRVRLVALLFTVMTPLWIVVDVASLSWPIWGWLSVERLVASITFALLVRLYPHSTSLRHAYRALALLFIIPSLFFLGSNFVLAHYQVEALGKIALDGYAFLPFVMLAGLSIFPLTALEGLIFAAPILGAQVLAIGLDFATLTWYDADRIATFWLLSLLASVATVSGMSQLRLMYQLNRQAAHDPLTDCFNRNSGEELLSIHFSLSRRQDQPLSLMFFDLDHFKSINDTYGHEVGDWVLQNAAMQLRESIRNEDILIRWGGEEFLLLLPNIDKAGAIHLADRLKSQHFGYRPDKTPVTASIGIAERKSDHLERVHDLVELADQRMYVAKQNGRDRFISEGGELQAAASTVN